MKLLLLPGDGIGPEVTAVARAVAERLISQGLALDIEEAAFGGASIDAHGTPLTDAAFAQARAADAVLMGAVGGPKWAGVPRTVRPERGLLRLRRELELFANLRPVRCWPALEDATPYKPQTVRGADLVFVRELTGGVYFGEPRGIEPLPGGGRRGFDTQVYTSAEIVRVARAAFRLAETRRGKVTSVDKANVMESGVLWREEVTALHAAEFAHVALDHMYADACAMALTRRPTDFDVILTDNLFGDVLSDAAAMIAGSLGMLPSAALGIGPTPGLYEPIHGSAPEIAGQDAANPCAAVLSLAMALRHSFGRADLAARVEAAVEATLTHGFRTSDLAGGSRRVGTAAMGTAILERLG